MKKYLLLFLCLVSSLMASAESGTCGDNLTWSLEDGILVISGTGAMTDYSSSSDVPWHSSRSTISLAFITEGVTSIGERAFAGCSGLTSISIPNSVTSIGVWAFSDCSGLTSITIPNSVTSIAYDAFYGCSGLTSVNITDLASWCNIDFGLRIANPTYYAHKLVLNGTEIKDLVIPEGVTAIKSDVFSNCSGLTSITIPDGVTSIGVRAFKGCSGLTSVTIPNSVTSIGGGAFIDCSGLTSITIPNSVTSIGDVAFSDCSGLTSVTIPNSVTSIGEWAFLNCSGLTSISVLATTPPTCGPFLLQSAGTSTIHVYEGLADVYKDASGWSEYDIVDDIPAIRVTSITLDATRYLCGIAQKFTPQVVAYEPENATFKEVTWSSSDPSTLTIVANTGECIGLKDGIVTITATAKDAGHATATATVYVGYSFSEVQEGAYILKNTSGYGEEYLYEQNGLLYSSTDSKGDVWLIRKSGTGYSICNARTGNYIQDTVGGQTSAGLSQLTTGTNPVIFYFTDQDESTCLIQSLDMITSQTCINAAGWGTPVGVYSGLNDNTSKWQLIIQADLEDRDIVTMNISQAGNLAELVDQFGGTQSIKKLKLTGEMNADDVRTLQQFRTSLTYLDLSEVEIVSGGYYTATLYYNDVNITTSTNGISYAMLCEFSELEIVKLPNATTYVDQWVFSSDNKLREVYMLNTTPPSFTNKYGAVNNFWGYSLSNVTLYVPEGCKDAYSSTHWQDLGTIVEIHAPYGGDYHVNFDKDIQRDDYSTDHPNRWLESFTLNGQTVTMNTNHQPYQDMTSTEVVLGAGQEVSVDCKQWNTTTYQYTNPWMHSYIYIDENNDGNFSFQVNNDAHTVNGELVSYSYYSFGGEERIGWNSKGGETNWANSIVPPSFMAPSTPGIYRLRFKTDWNDLNPAGSLGSENNVLGTNGILRNSGCIVDITIRVVDTQLVDGSIYEMESDLNNISLSYTRTFNNTEWQALYVPFLMSYEDWADDFEVAKINNFHQYDTDDDGNFDKLELEIIKVKSGTLKANHPYLIKALRPGEKTITLENATLYPAEENSFVCNSMETTYTFTGTYTGVSGSDMYNNHYYSMGGGAMILAEDATASLKPFRWYLSITDRDGQVIPNPSSVRIMIWDSETTDIESCTLDNTPSKSYTLDGRVITSPKAKGIFISNGKKFLR